MSAIHKLFSAIKPPEQGFWDCEIPSKANFCLRFFTG